MQGYRVKPLGVLVSGSPRSYSDVFCALAYCMASVSGQQGVVDYRLGAGGAMGAANMVKTLSAECVANIKAELVKWIRVTRQAKITRIWG